MSALSGPTGEHAPAPEGPYTCRNCGLPLHRCALGDDCSLYGWRHPNGDHECAPRLGGLLFTFPAELDPALDAPMRGMRQNVRGQS